jgi:hypothetical protein
VLLLVTARQLWWKSKKLFKSQMGTHNSSEMVAALGTPCAIPPLTLTVVVVNIFLGTACQKKKES